MNLKEINHCLSNCSDITFLPFNHYIGKIIEEQSILNKKIILKLLNRKNVDYKTFISFIVLIDGLQYYLINHPFLLKEFFNKKCLCKNQITI